MDARVSKLRIKASSKRRGRIPVLRVYDMAPIGGLRLALRGDSIAYSMPASRCVFVCARVCVRVCDCAGTLNQCPVSSLYRKAQILYRKTRGWRRCYYLQKERKLGCVWSHT